MLEIVFPVQSVGIFYVWFRNLKNSVSIKAHLGLHLFMIVRSDILLGSLLRDYKS